MNEHQLISAISKAADLIASAYGAGRHATEHSLRAAVAEIKALSDAAEAADEIRELRRENAWLNERLNATESNQRDLKQTIRELRKKLFKKEQQCNTTL